jgi:MFS family permease
LRGFDEGVVFYPLYALLFAAAGLSTAQITSLFVIWSGVSFVLEVPSGAWADAFSRRRLLAAGAVIRAAGFLAWGVFPNYFGFAFGFVC